MGGYYTTMLAEGQDVPLVDFIEYLELLVIKYTYGLSTTEENSTVTNY